MAISNDGDELTSFEDMCTILSDLWINHKHEKSFADFISYNDLGLPLAFLIDSELVIPTELAKRYITETWDILLKSLEIENDPGFESLEELFDYSKKDDK